MVKLNRMSATGNNKLVNCSGIRLHSMIPALDLTAPLSWFDLAVGIASSVCPYVGSFHLITLLQWAFRPLACRRHIIHQYTIEQVDYVNGDARR